MATPIRLLRARPDPRAFAADVQSALGYDGEH